MILRSISSDSSEIEYSDISDEEDLVEEDNHSIINFFGSMLESF